MISDLYFYLTAIPAVLIYAIGKGGFGGALGVIAVPLMSLTAPPSEAASVLLPILCVMDFFAVRYHYRACLYDEIKRMLPFALVGVVGASLVMTVMPERVVELFVGGLSIAFCAQYYLVGDPKSCGRVLGSFWSTLSGFSSTMIHAGGAPINMYLLPKNYAKEPFVATMAVFFAILNLIKLIPYTVTGQFDDQTLLTSLVLIPLAPIGVKLGVRLLSVCNQQQVYRICYFLLLLSGAKLFYSGLFPA